jgi:hypothetical protein
VEKALIYDVPPRQMCINLLHLAIVLKAPLRERKFVALLQANICMCNAIAGALHNAS